MNRPAYGHRVPAARPSVQPRRPGVQPRRPGAQSQGAVRPPSPPNRVAWSPWLRIAVVAFILVYVGRIHEAIPGVGAIPIGNVTTLCLVGLLLLGGYLHRLPVVLKAPTIRYGIGLLALGAISIPFALWPGGALGAYSGTVKGWLLCLVLPLAITSTAELRTVARVFTVSGLVLVSGYLLEAFAGRTGFTDSQSLGFDRNDVALLAAMGIPFALAWAKTAGRLRLAGYGAAAMLVAGIIATGSRGGFLAMAAVGLAFLVRSKLLSVPKKLALVALAVVLALSAGSTEYWDRIESIFSDPTEDYNFQAREGRIEIWKRGISYARTHPVTGVGFGNFPVAEGENLENLGYGVKWSTAHNAYLLVLAELGLPGLIVFLAIIWQIVRAIRGARLLRPPGRHPPASPLGEAGELATLADATALSLLAYAVAAVFLSVSYGIAFVFLVAMGTSLFILRGRVVARVRARMPPPAAVRS